MNVADEMAGVIAPVSSINHHNVCSYLAPQHEELLFSAELQLLHDGSANSTRASSDSNYGHFEMKLR